MPFREGKVTGAAGPQGPGRQPSLNHWKPVRDLLCGVSQTQHTLILAESALNSLECGEWPCPLHVALAGVSLVSRVVLLAADRCPPRPQV